MSRLLLFCGAAFFFATISSAMEFKDKKMKCKKGISRSVSWSDRIPSQGSPLLVDWTEQQRKAFDYLKQSHERRVGSSLSFCEDRVIIEPSYLSTFNPDNPKDLRAFYYGTGKRYREMETSLAQRKIVLTCDQYKAVMSAIAGARGR
jgi:hypothetical protein